HVRVVGDELELAHVHIELLCRDHQQTERPALTDLNAVRVQRRCVVRMNTKPRIDLVHVDWTVRGKGILAGGLRLRTNTRTQQAEADDQRAASLHEVLTRKLLLMKKTRHRYFPPFAITAAACLIAVRIRG